MITNNTLFGLLIIDKAISILLNKSSIRPNTCISFYYGWAGVIGLTQKEIRFNPKWDKSGTFSNQMSVYFLLAEPECTEI